MFRNTRHRRLRERVAAKAMAHVIEQLERRVMLSAWSVVDVPSSFPDGTQTPGTASTMLMLPNGAVMIQAGGESSSWYRLTPDSNTSPHPNSPPYSSPVDPQRYINGTFTPLASSSVAREYYASDVLPNGNVFVAGGELATLSDGTQVTESTSAETFNPLSGTLDSNGNFEGVWNSDANFPPPNGGEQGLGDAPSELLADGNILVGDPFHSDTQIYNPTANTWTTDAPLLYNDTSSEESWVKLSDGSVLTVDLHLWPVYTGVTTETAQRFVPGQDQWVSAGSLPVALLSNASNTQSGTPHDVGAGVLLDNGDAFYIGGSGETALYNPATNLWSAGPEIRDSAGTLYGANDGPAAVLPNGDVLFAGASPTGFSPPTQFFLYDPAANTITAIGIPNGSDFTFRGSESLRMLTLPDGSVLISDQTGTLWMYTPDAPTQAQLQQTRQFTPTISTITDTYRTASYNNSLLVFSLSGLNLNGMSEGAYYGDDAQMASNFPIVTLTPAVQNTGGLDTNGPVDFLLSHNWSSVVQTGNAVVSTQFDAPIPQGQPQLYFLSVSGAGLVSGQTLFIKLPDNSASTLTLTQSSNGQWTVSGAGAGIPFSGSFSGTSQINQIIVDCGGGSGGTDAITITPSSAASPFGGVTIVGGEFGATDSVTANLNGAAVSFTGGSSFTLDGTPVNCFNVQSLTFAATGGTSMVSGTNVNTTTPLTLNVGANSVLALTQAAAPQAAVFQVAGISIDPLGRLDIGRSEMLLTYGSTADPMTTVLNYLRSGYNGGAWNGTGLISTFAATLAGPSGIGYVDSADGTGFNTTPNSVELKYAYYGDLNLAGTVNFADFSKVVADYNKPEPWDGGAVTYGNTVSFADFAITVSNYGKSAFGAYFASAATYAAGNAPDAVAIADVNGDGIPDVIVADRMGNCVGVMLGNGNGTFAPVQTFSTAVPYGIAPVAVAVADINGDGKPDLIVTNTMSSRISLLMGNGNGTFQPPVALMNATYVTRSVAVADVNGDGKPYLVAADYAAHKLTILAGNGNGTFKPPQIISLNQQVPYQVTVADVNGDGNADLIVAVKGGVDVLLADGPDNFPGVSDVFVTGASYCSIALADVNGDGKPDVVATDLSTGTVSVFLGNGNGTFGAQTFAAGLTTPDQIAAADINGDGSDDLIVRSQSGQISLLLGNGNGTFQAPQTLTTVGGPFAVADVNGDGRPDLVIAYTNGNSITVLLNKSLY